MVVQLQSRTPLHPNPCFSSSLSSTCRPHPCSSPHFNLKSPPTRIRSPISQARGHGTVDYERRRLVKWDAVFRKISFMAKQDPALGSAAILNQWEKQGKSLTKWDLCRIIKELRKYNRHQQALEVYDWMSSREERYILAPSDAAIQLDLIAKVSGIPSAENFFHRLPENLKDNRIYGALLNSYVRAKMREEAESLFEEMRVNGYATHPLPFNVMMTLYMKLKEYAKVESMVSEMMVKNIKLDIYSYNIWLSCCGSQGSSEKMERTFDQMKLDKTVYPNWATFSTMATMYVKLRQLGKVEECLKKAEGRIKGRERVPFHYLLSLYGAIGKKEEVLRVWNTYKSAFPTIPNLGYHSLIGSLIKLGEVSEAEKIYEEWLLGKTYYDARIANHFMRVYVKEGDVEKAESFFRHMVEEGGKPTSGTWEILAQGRIRQRLIPDALSCFQEAFSTQGSKSWRLKQANISAFSNLCEEEGDAERKEALLELLRQSGHLEDEAYASNMGFSQKDDSEYDESEDDESGIILNQIAG